jgi:hypothetical protein
MKKSPPETFFAVTGSQRPYIYDLPQVLSLPRGFEFRFRYRHQWIDSQLWDRIRNRPESFEGRTLILLFHSQEEKRVVPLRRATIVRIEELGALVFIRFRLDEFVKAPLLDLRAFGREASNQRKKQSVAWMDTISQFGGSGQGFGQFDLAKSLPDGWYFRAAAPSNLEWSADDVEAWGALATMLQDEANLSGVPLFYVLGFEDEHRKLIKPSVVRNRFRRNATVTGYRLVERARYRLRLLTWNGSYPRAAAMRVNSHVDPAILSLEGAADLVLGRYDVLEYTFLGNKAGYTELGIAAEPIEPIGESEEASERAEEPTGIVGRVAALVGWRIEPLRAPEKRPSTATDQWKTWPAIYLARIPIKMRASIPRALLTLLLAISGIALYLGAPRLFPPAKAGEPPSTIASGLQALGLLIAFICVSGITEKLIKVREHVIKLGEKPKLPAP